jgi:peroxiredoxin
MKKVFLLLVALSLIMPAGFVDSANGKVEGRVGSKTVKICDKGYNIGSPITQVGSVVYFPVRFFADRFGADVTWDNFNRTATVKGFGLNFSVNLKSGIVLNVNTPVSFGEKPLIIDGKTSIGLKTANVLFGINFSSNGKNIDSNVDCDRIKYRWADFTLPVDRSQLGETIQLSKVLANGKTKVVVLEFWYTQCTHCWEQLEHLETLYQKYKDRGLEIFSITTDGPGNEGSRWEKIEELGYTYKTLLDTKAETYASYFQPVFPNLTVIVPGEKFYKLRRDPVSKGDNDELEKLIESLCSSN